MTAAVFALPAPIDTLTGGYGYARKVVELLPEHGVPAEYLELSEAFPHPTEAALSEASARLGAVPRDKVLLIDGLVFGALPDHMLKALQRPVIAIIHHPLGLEHGLSGDDAQRLLISERQALAMAAHVIVPSRTTSLTVQTLFGVPASRITIAPPGIDPAPRAPGPLEDHQPLKILSVGSLIPRKGFDILVDALALIADRSWEARIIGGAEHDPACANALRKQIAARGLEGRIALPGAFTPDRLATVYQQADMFVLPSRYEGYGMVFAEAMARGLPVIGASAGALPEVVPASAGLLVPKDDPYALAGAILRLIDDPGFRRRLADGAWNHAQQLPRWKDTAAIIAQVLKRSAP
ncbi:glycosyltransferase family 4 protein [Rhodoligotrophos defluvii]|uniref:glycosyltransferase family 4 protein n=1 Tax=Rhodoligotrophos defluvii TaxID=2561934 RepID=UPI0010C99E8E|nr:glycosyltransferase family 4 protein [Rhodoligotrophos defluvii]